MKQITLFSDGYALKNPGSGGYATLLRYNESERELSGGEAHTTKNRMELLGVIEGLRLLKEPCEIEVITDASYVVKGINEWLANWVKRDFTKVKNADLWREYLKVSQQHKVKATWTRAGMKPQENRRCQHIAQREAERFKAEGNKIVH